MFPSDLLEVKPLFRVEAVNCKVAESRVRMRFVSVINRFDFFEGEIAAGLLIVGVIRATVAAVGLPNG